METIEAGPFEYADKLPLKHGFAEAGVRALPGASARWGSFLGRGVVLMPCYVNIGARVGADTMVDTWATVGSCAQIGARVHLAGGVGIGGVLDHPTRCPSWSRTTPSSGAVHGHRGGPDREGSRAREREFLNPSIPVIDAETGEEIAAGWSRRGAVAMPASRRREYPGGDSSCPACS